MIHKSFLGAILAGTLTGTLMLSGLGCGNSSSTGNGGGDTGGGGGNGGTNAGGSNTGGNGTGGNASTSSGGDIGKQPAAAELYGPAIKTIVFEVDYSTGAEPYTGAQLGMGDTWDLFEKNAADLFEGGNKTLMIPHTLGEMEEIGDLSGQDFASKDILALADAHRGTANTADTAAIYVIWLPGYYKDADGVQKNVLGVSFGKTGVIAMFKPVIAGSSSTPLVASFVEQTTLIHEFGHAAGLVNNGIEMVKAHQDEPNGAHCTNKDCVMYYLNEGASDMLQFAEDSIASGDTHLFGDECLDDAHAATAK